jgi:hypothetical protein
MIVDRKTHLLQIIRTLHSPRGFPGRLNRGQQKPDENPDYRDNYQQFDEREAPRRPMVSVASEVSEHAMEFLNCDTRFVLSSKPALQ